MEKSYFEFVETLRTELIAFTGKTGEQIFFRQKGELHAENGDRLFVECEKNEEVREYCGIHTQTLYERYQKERDMNRIVRVVVKEVESAGKSGCCETAKKLMDYEQAKKYLFVRLVNYNQHKESLKQAIYSRVGDIAMVLYMKVAEGEGVITSAKVTKEHIASWDTDLDWEEILTAALKNTYKMTPPRLYSWEKLIRNLDYEGESFMDDEDEFELSTDCRGNCLSTTKKTNGAAAIFLPGVAKRLADLMDSDLYLAFTSVHEVMVHNADAVDPTDLKQVLEETIKEATPKEDYLSSYIYHYSRKNKCFSKV
jgi:hypothetical protein